MLTIQNEGPRIISTNYWETIYAQQGRIYCSTNAGAIRILLPDSMIETLDDMEPAQLVVASFGPIPVGAISRRFGETKPFPPQHVPVGLELMWDDGSDSPFELIVGQGQFDRVPARQYHGRTCDVTVWTRGLGNQPVCVLERGGRIRHSPALPDMSPFQPSEG